MPTPDTPIADWLTMSEEALLKHCRVDTYRASGPGGQKRNKTSSAVRITHLPTAQVAIAHESRSQHENKAKALKRLRHRLALHLRTAVALDGFTLPAWFIGLQLSPKHERYLPTVAMVLDVLDAAGYSVSAAAQSIGVTTAQLVAFLQADEPLLAEVNAQRRRRNLRPLGAHQ